MIYMLLTDGFEETETIETLDIIRRAGLEIQLVGLDGVSAVGAHGVRVGADIGFDGIIKENTDMLILPGGPGHENLDSDERVHKLIDFCLENDKYLAAICAAPSILGKRGITKGKRVTCFPGYEKYMTDAVLTGEKSVCDGKIITAKGAGAASDFGFMIVERLADKKLADKIKAAMQY